MLANLPVIPQLRAADAKRAKRFYTDKLGLPLIMEMDGVFMVGAGKGTRLVVYQREDEGPPTNTVASWETDDIHAVARDLRERGIKPELYDMPGVEYDEDGIATGFGMQTLWFTDSEGNVLQVVQPPA